MYVPLDPSRTPTEETTMSPNKTAEALSSLSAEPRPAWLDERLYPFESRYVEIDGNRVHYVDEGTGPTLLLLHPAPAWSFIYRNFIVGLRDRFRCVALDYPGFGLSTAGEGYGYTLAEHSDIVEKFVQRLGLSEVTMMVHDSGGPIGLSVATRRPDIFKAFVLTDTFGWSLGDHNPSVARMLKFVSGPVFGSFNQTFNLLPWIVATFGARRRKLSKAERVAYTKAFPTWASRRRIQTLFRDLYAEEDYMREVEQGLEQHLKDRPVLLMYGENDAARRAGFMSHFEEIFPRHHSVLIEGEQHFPHEGAPDEMIAEIREWWPGDGPEQARGQPEK
jgi:haloalkane dehalogenase